MSKYKYEVVITINAVLEDGLLAQLPIYHSMFDLKRDDLDNKGIMAWKAIDAMEYLAQEMKRHDIKKNDRD